MPLKFVGSSAVIVAHHFNPSIMGQVWLVNHGIVAIEDFMPGTVFTDVFVQVNSRNLTLLVTPDQCQLSPRGERDHELEIVHEKLGTIVNTLPHTPFTGIGLNFIWQAIAAEDAVRALSRRLFFVDGSPLHDSFREPESRFGGYLSKESLGCRLKLDVKPARTDDLDADETVHYLQFTFNFHKDLAGETPESIIATLTQWEAAREQASNIVQHATQMDIE